MKTIIVIIVSFACAVIWGLSGDLFPLLGIPAIIIWAAIAQKNENDFDDYIDKNQ